MIDELHASALIWELVRKIKTCPPITLAFIDGARRTTTPLVVWNWHRYRSAWRTNKHIRLDRIRTSQVVRPVDTPFGSLKSLPRAIRLHIAASIFDGDRALSYDVVDKPGVIMPRTRRFADRRLERSGRQC